MTGGFAGILEDINIPVPTGVILGCPSGKLAWAIDSLCRNAQESVAWATGWNVKVTGAGTDKRVEEWHTRSEGSCKYYLIKTAYQASPISFGVNVNDAERSTSGIRVWIAL